MKLILFWAAWIKRSSDKQGPDYSGSTVFTHSVFCLSFYSYQNERDDQTNLDREVQDAEEVMERSKTVAMDRKKWRERLNSMPAENKEQILN